MADYLKIPELARRLDVSEKTARRYVKAGALPSTFIGGAYRVTEADLEEFFRAREVRPKVQTQPETPAEWPSQRAREILLEAARKEALREEQAANRALESDRPQSMITGDLMEAGQRVLDEFEPNDIAEVSRELALWVARIERENTHLRAALTLAHESSQERKQVEAEKT